MWVQIIKAAILLVLGNRYLDQINPSALGYAVIYTLFDALMNIIFVGATTANLNEQIRAIVITFILTFVCTAALFYLLRIMRGSLAIAWLFMIVGTVFIVMFL